MDFRHLLLTAGSVAVCLIAGGCNDSSTGFDTISSDGLGVVDAETELIGTVVDDRGCFKFREEGSDQALWLLWPEGTKSVNDNRSVRTRAGTEFSPGDIIVVDGVLLGREGLPDGSNPDSMWGSYARFCLGADESQDDEILRAVTVEHVE